MNKQELRKRLMEEGVMESAYSLEGGLPWDQYVLSEDSAGNWSVYYSERGEKLGLRTFRTEDEACLYMLQRILADPTTRRRV